MRKVIKIVTYQVTAGLAAALTASRQGRDRVVVTMSGQKPCELHPSHFGWQGGAQA